ncbi:hypothetical protein CK500_02550 [Halorubrum salipaludis]|uniref:Uncharacterized protein n=1 Tax=Halorubrum salipaludis TaxID=2032630 RepID=A0A2A2FLM7_9EURY|nr:hypothetical protein [Halorubrum salipaludis]PAU85567.1 hypothetical protein CK500_02550 [Halorubrum salipaludis]
MTELATSVHRSIAEVKRGEWNAVVAQQSRTGSGFERYEWLGSLAGRVLCALGSDRIVSRLFARRAR